MKIFFVSDNRDHPNWGCRATSEALENLMRSIPGLDPEFKHVGVDDIHIVQPCSGVIKSRKILNLLAKISFMRKNPYHKLPKRMIANFIYFVLYPLFQRPFFCSDSIPNSESELEFFLQVFKNGGVLEKERDMVVWSDVVIANGEGAFYRNERKGKYILFLLYLAKVIYKKPVMLVNHMFDVKSEELLSLCQKIYPLLDKVVFRDHTSLQIFQKSVPGVAAEVAGDAAFSHAPTGKDFSRYLLQNPKIMDTYYGHANSWPVNFKRPFVIIGGSSIIFKPFFVKGYNAVEEFTHFVKAFQKENINVVIAMVCPGDKFLKEVAQMTGAPFVSVETSTQLAVDFFSEASCFISGRYHPMILASVSGTPTIAFDSNSHKTRSLHELLGLIDQPYFELKNLRADTPAIIKHVRSIIDHEQAIRAKILSNVLGLKKDVKKQVEFLEQLLKRDINDSRS